MSADRGRYPDHGAVLDHCAVLDCCVGYECRAGCNANQHHRLPALTTRADHQRCVHHERCVDCKR